MSKDADTGSDKRTKSEMLFEEFCDLQQIQYRRLQELQHRRQPDYELTFAGQSVVFEIKQADPNEDDTREANELKRNGMVFGNNDPNDTADRVRNLLKSGNGQIKAYNSEHPHTPGVIVILDNASVGNRFTDPYIIQTAMFGWEQVEIEHSVAAPPQVTERGFGKRNDSTVRRDRSKAISAVATLHEGHDLATKVRIIALCFYHNQYADYPFVPAWWTGEHVFHFILSAKESGQFQDWESLPIGDSDSDA